MSAPAAPEELQQPLLQREDEHKPPYHHQQQQQDTFWPCAINLTKAITGAGMMAIPRAFFLVGWLPGTLMMAGVAALTTFTMAVLVQGSAAAGPGHASTYAELVQHTLGTTMMRLLQLAVLMFCFGFSVVYLVVIRDILLGEPDQCNGLLCEAFGPAANIDPSLLVIGVAILVCAPLLMLRSMDRLAALNAAGVAASILLAVVSTALAVLAAVSGQAHPVSMLPQWELLGPTWGQQIEALTDVIPVVLACYVAHQSLHPLMPLLKPYSQQRMIKVVAVAISMAGCIFLTLSVGAAVAFGPATDVNMLENLSIAGLEPLLGSWRLAVAVSWVVRGGYLVCILATLLLFMHPLRSCLAQMLWPEPTYKPDAGVGAGLQTQAPVEAAAVEAVAPTDVPSAVVGATSDAAAAAVDGNAASSSTGAAAAQQVQQQQQQQPPLPCQQGQQQQQMWQVLEQSTYYPLTYGLLAAMVLVAVIVTNIYVALSAVGDIASTMQAFIVPGAIAVVLAERQVRSHRQAVAAARASVLQDVEQGSNDTSSATLGGGSAAANRTPLGAVSYAAAGTAVMLLGVMLFGNGLYQRLSELMLVLL